MERKYDSVKQLMEETSLSELRRLEEKTGKKITIVVSDSDEPFLSREIVHEENPIEKAARERGVKPRPSETNSEIATEVHLSASQTASGHLSETERAS